MACQHHKYISGAAFPSNAKNTMYYNSKVRVLINLSWPGPKSRGPGQRVEVGHQRQGGFHSESQLYPSCKLKTKKKRP